MGDKVIIKNENILVDIVPPVKLENFDESYANEDKLKETKAIIEDFLYSEKYKYSLLNEGFLNDVGKLGLNIPAIFRLINNYLTGQYKMRYNVVTIQAKEVNDKYIKVKDLIENDRAARAKHGKDIISVTLNVVRLMGKDGTIYNPTYVILLVDPESIDRYVQSYIDSITPKNYKEITQQCLNILEKDFSSRHQALTTTPCVKSATFNRVRLEESIRVFKNNTEVYYATIYNVNNVLSNELLYLQAIEQCYTTTRRRYTAKEHKYFTDMIFKFVLDYTSRAMDFNSKLVNLTIDVLGKTADELDRIYNILRE